MMQNIWKKLFIASAVLLVISIVLSTISLYRFNQLESSLSGEETDVTYPIYEPGSTAEKWQSNYSDIRTQIYLRLGTGPDAMLFITPDEPEITKLVQEITGGYSEEFFWKDYIKMYRWILINIDYTLDSPLPILPESLDSTVDDLYWESDFWRLPVETLSAGKGDCEDMANLLVSMVLNYNQRKFPIWIIGARTENPYAKAHLAVAIPLQGAHFAIFDISGRYYTPFEEMGGFGSLYFPNALEQWLKHLERTNMFESEIYVAHSEDFYTEFSGNEDFLEWVFQYYAENDSL
ncbi:transglutaminase-like domain-containing protein [Chloroflexota bacterium]